MYLVIFFFFSSRRRHTRLTCDWSSDVCSSDLHPGFRGWSARAAGDAARGPEHRESFECDRWPHHEPRRLRREPAKAEARRGDLRLAQDDQPAPQDAPSGDGASRLDVRLRSGRLQLDPDPQLGGATDMTTPWARVACSQSPVARAGRYRPGPDSSRKASTRMRLFFSPVFSAAC